MNHIYDDDDDDIFIKTTHRIEMKINHKKKQDENFKTRVQCGKRVIKKKLNDANNNYKVEKKVSNQK